ncbi:mesoderm induction early response protein 1 [Caerostris extrusa]|uniref:Mesoderm induction early response protein 1 n=1 Tax=Caerostris extrusa TaxID=172846 RepID=A0AAV4U4H5_CAEEX|nr:mesoderm induction early response protein 1 [Caerostris extrusa]
MAEPNTSASESSADLSDSDFDPDAEILINDFDDEYTMEEEEEMESVESVTNELDDLQREGEMPLNEVLAMYGYESGVENEEKAQESSSSPEQDSDSSFTPTLLLECHSSPQEIMPRKLPDFSTLYEGGIDEVIDLGLREEPLPLGRPLLRSVHQASESSDTGTDYDYADDDWRKTIQVGPDYQAVIPEGLSRYDDVPAYENEDRLLWDPTVLPDNEESRKPIKRPTGVYAIPTGSHVRDDEQALYLLLQCGFSQEEALRRKRMQPIPAADTMTLWSEEECRSFENGLRIYGKDFHLIQMNKVRTRSVSELVQFYYIWKKTERHDVFANKYRTEKKKYALNPGTTDFMDRFLEEQENPQNLRDQSSSPTSNLPMCEELKKLTPLTSPETHADNCTPEHSTDSLLNNSGLEQEGKSHSSHSNRECLNGNNKNSTAQALSKDDDIICLSLECVNESITHQTTDAEKSILITSDLPGDASCSHLMNNIARFQETCNFRFDYKKDTVSIDLKF